MNSLATIRAKCKDCSGWSQKDVDTCQFTSCSLHPFRYGKRPKTAAKQGKAVAEQTMTPSKAIRLNCLWCTKNQPVEVRECPSTQCPSYPWRFGKPPVKSGRRGNPEALQRARNGILSQKKPLLAAKRARVGADTGVSPSGPSQTNTSLFAQQAA